MTTNNQSNTFAHRFDESKIDSLTHVVDSIDAMTDRASATLCLLFAQFNKEAGLLTPV